MYSCKITQRSRGNVGATACLKTKKESISKSADTCAKPAVDLPAATPAQVRNIENCMVNQILYVVAKYEKQHILKNLIKENEGKRILVFVEKKRNADFLAALLCEQKLPTTSIHGGRVRRDRELALQTFESGRCRILIATKVALDIKNVDVVVNYDLPKSMDVYVHRIELTGRGGKAGKAVSFFDEDQNADLLGDLAKSKFIFKRTIPYQTSCQAEALSAAYHGNICLLRQH